MTTTTRGPWVRSGRSWSVTLRLPGSNSYTYELDYIRASDGAPGWYLFGPNIAGQLALSSDTAEMARYEAFVRAVQLCPLPDAALDWLAREVGR